jgi:NADH-quinone oxidoreductase subunit M
MLRRAFFGPLREPANGHGGAAHDLNGRELAALVPIAVLCVGIGVFPKPFLDPMQPELKALERIYQDPARLQPPGLTETTAETRP